MVPDPPVRGIPGARVEAACLCTNVRAVCRLCAPVSSVGVWWGGLSVSEQETLGTNSARVSAGARDRVSPTGVSVRIGDRVGAARRGGDARNLLRLTLPDWLFDPERPGRGRGARAHARARGGARA